MVSPDAPSNVAFIVSGKVIQVGPREGDYVRKGDILAVIDPTDYQLGVNAAAAQVATARAALRRVEAPARPEVLEQARIALDRTEDEYRRMKMLYDSKSLPPNDFRKFQAAYEAARQQYEQAKAGGQKEDRAQSQAGIDQAVAMERIAQQHLADATLRSPMAGFVAGRTIEPGEMASPGRPVFQIVQLDPVEIRVGVPETDIHLVRVGQTAFLHVPALPGESFGGTLRVINVAADAGTRTYMARIRVANPKHVLRLGMVAEARIQGDRMLDVLTLPGAAVVHDPQGATIVFVYFPDKKRVYAKRVEVGTVYGQEIQIGGGLTGDEQVVLAGQDKLRDGAAVDAIAVEPPPEAQ